MTTRLLRFALFAGVSTCVFLACCGRKPGSSGDGTSQTTQFSSGQQVPGNPGSVATSARRPAREDGAVITALPGFVGRPALVTPTEFRIYPILTQFAPIISEIRGTVELEGVTSRPAALRPSANDRYLVANLPAAVAVPAVARLVLQKGRDRALAVKVELKEVVAMEFDAPREPKQPPDSPAGALEDFQKCLTRLDTAIQTGDYAKIVPLTRQLEVSAVAYTKHFEDEDRQKFSPALACLRDAISTITVAVAHDDPQQMTRVLGTIKERGSVPFTGR